MLERWRQASALGESEGDEWDDPQSTELLQALMTAAGVWTEPDVLEPGARRDARLGAVDRATRSWARVQPSLPVLTSRLTALRKVLTSEEFRDRRPELLEEVSSLVVATANEEYALRLQQAAMTDPLTGIGNRRALDLSWQAAVLQSKRLGQSVCLVAIDLDGLKRINDFQGHAAGDGAIVNLCAALRAALRDTDEVFRIGGDEFVVMLPGSSSAAAAEMMVRIHQYHAPRFSWGAADTIQDGPTLDAVLGCADQRLYAQRRKNRPVAWTPMSSTQSPKPAVRSRFSPRRAIEMIVTGALVLAIGAVVVSISGGNHAICATGNGPTIVDCGLSNAVYYGGIALLAAGGVVLTIAAVAWTILRGTN